MTFHGYDPGDRNNWYQSPQLGLFQASPTGSGGEYYCLPSYHPHGTQFPSQPSYPPPPSQFPFQPSYSPPPPSPTIINGYVFPHQFPSSHTYHSSDSNPNPWIYPSISQSLSYDPSVTSVNSHFVSTKTMPTPPISHYAPSPPVCEQPHTISYPNLFCPIPVFGPSRISLHTDRIHNGEVPIVDSSGYSLIPEPTVKLKGVEKPHPPPQGSVKLQESLQSSMDTFISEFREELRLLKGSLQSPGSQVDNPLKFGSPPPSSTPELIPAATEASSSLIPADNGIICQTPVDSDLNLSSPDVILGFYDNTSMDHIVVGTAITSTAALVGGEKDWNYNGSEESRNHSRKGPIGENLVANPIATIQSADRYENQIYPAAKLDKDDDASDYEKGVIEKCNKIGDAAYNEEVETSNLCGDEKSKGATETFSRDHVSNLESVSCLSDFQVKFETSNLCGNEEKYMFVTVGNLCRALVFKCCPISIVKVPEKWFLDAMNMNLDIMVGKIKCSVEKELLENFHENHLKLDEKCLRYVMSTLDALYAMQKLGFKFDCQNLYQLLSSLSKLEGDLEDLDRVRNINWEENAKKLNFAIREGLKLDNRMAVCFTDSQSRSHLLKWFILCFEFCHCETKLFWKEAFDGLGELTQNSLSWLISTLRISPELHSVVFIPNAKENLAITGAICFLKVVVNDSQVVEVIQCPADLHCSQLVLSPKGLGTTLVTVYDIGIAPPLASSDVVQVAEVAWIKIMSLEVTSLMEGNSHTIDIMAGISGDTTFDSYQFTYISVQVHVEDPITEMSSSGGENINVPKFKSFASHLGITTFFINALQQSGHEILSHPIMVEVYAPSDIHLHDIFLVPGESYVLTLEESPKIGANVEFTSLELLQNEYQIDQVDVKAVIAIVIIQLHSNETTELCKGMDKLLQAFGIYIAFAYLAYHLCSVGPQLLIEQFIDVAFVGNFYDTNVDQWLPAHDERSFCEGTKRISRRLLTLLIVYHFNNKMVQQFSYLQIILKKLIQAELQVCKSNLDKLSDSSFLVWSFQLLEPKISFERPQPRVYHVGSRKSLRIIGFYDSSGHQPLAWCTFNPCSEDNSHIFLVNILGGFCLVALCSIKVSLVGMLNIIVAASLCVVCLTSVLLKSIAGFLSWKLSSYYCKCNSILPIVVIVDASEQIQQSFLRIVLYSMFVSYMMMAQNIIVEDNIKQVGTAWTFESTDIIAGPVKMFNDEWGQPTSKLAYIILILEIATSCYELQNTFANVRMGMMTPSYTSNDKLGVHEATKMTKLADKGNVSFHQWGITFFIFYFEFVYHLFMSQCCWYNILGVASETTIIFKMLHMVDFCQDAPHAPRFSFRI